MRWLFIFAVFACFNIATQSGCATPDSVKKCLATSGFAIDYARDAANGNTNITKPLGDAKKLLGPVSEYIGEPDGPVTYDPKTTRVDLMAAHASLEVKMQKMFEGFAKNMADKVLPAQLKAFIPNSEKQKPPMAPETLAGIIAIVYGIMTGGKEGIKAIIRKNNKK